MDQKHIIQLFVDKYNQCQDDVYTIAKWPDEENRTSRDIDAHAIASNGKSLAIEHTKIESFFGQLADNERFGQYYGELETDLKHFFDFYIALSLPVFAFQKGTKWASVRDLIREWLILNAINLPDGFSLIQIDGVPFRISIYKEKDRERLFSVARRAPSDADVEVESILSIAGALKNKNSQMQKYRESGSHNVLILESPDIALISHISLYKAFLQAITLDSCPNIDEVWLARTNDSDAANHCSIFCMQGPLSIMDRVNPENFMWGPRHADMWEDAINQDKKERGRIDLESYIVMRDR